MIKYKDEVKFINGDLFFRGVYLGISQEAIQDLSAHGYREQILQEIYRQCDKIVIGIRNDRIDTIVKQ